MAESRVSGVGLEVLTDGGPSTARVTSAAVEVLNSGGLTTARATSVATEVLVSVTEYVPPGPSVELEALFNDEDGLAVTLTTSEPAPDLELSVSFLDDGGLSAKLSTTRYLAVAFTDDNGISRALPTTTRPLKLLQAKYRDDLGLSVTMTTTPPDPTPGINLEVGFTDDAGLSATLTTKPKDILLSVNFADDAGLRVNANILPLDGPFFFTWADEGETFQSGLASIETEDVYSFTVQQSEGDFASAQVVIRNPRVGLLKAGRKRWAFMSIKRDGILVPFFYGRVVAIPGNIFEELITLDLVARPFDFATRKEALAATLRVLPWFDPIFIDPDSWPDPDTVLEARTANWHIDRVTHEVTISDIINPEDGVMEFTQDDYFFDNMQLTLAAAPVRAVRIQSTIPWDLTATGTFDLSERITMAFVQAQSTSPDNYKLVQSFTFDGLKGDWPKEGAKVGDGWRVATGELVDVTYQAVPPYVIGPPFDESTIPQAVAQGSFVYPLVVTDGEYHSGEDAGFNINVEMVVVPIGYGVANLSVTYEAGRNMGQFANFVMKTDVQDVLTLADEADEVLVTVNANPVTDTSYWGDVPLADSRERDFIRTPRGQQALHHLMLVARAHLAEGSRVVETTFETDFLTGLDVTLRKGALIHNPRIPGGQQLGKISGYSLSLDGDSGVAIASIQIKSAVGKGGAYTEMPGDPDYIEDAYIQPGHFARKNQIFATPAGDVAWTVPPWQKFDDGLDFRAMTATNIVKSVQVQNGSEDQRAILAQYEGADQAVVSAALQNVPTMVTLELVPLSGGPFLGEEAIITTDLVLPKQIDLEADSNG